MEEREELAEGSLWEMGSEWRGFPGDRHRN